MTDIFVLQMPAFKKSYKKLHKYHQKQDNESIKMIINNPELGEEKKGDLAGVYVYKFKINKQEFLLAYEWDIAQRLLITLGVHENFYRGLKKLK